MTISRKAIELVLAVTSAIFIIISMAGCSDNKPAVQPNNNTVKSVPQPELNIKAIEEKSDINEMASDKGYVYEQLGRRDPFAPLIQPAAKQSKKKGPRVLGTLESYDIALFTLAAIVKKGNEYIALLVAPDNKSFSIHKGNKVGLNNGKVKSISKNSVELAEESLDYLGKIKSRSITLEFNKGEQE